MASRAKAILRCPQVWPNKFSSGAIGLKLHEDWGTKLRRRRLIAVCAWPDEHDVQVTIHTDTLNESGFVDATIAALKGRTIHTYHSEGAGGGHAPDIIRICSGAKCAAQFDQPDPALYGQYH